MQQSDSSNQAETMTSTSENDPHLGTSDGKHLKMPGAGIMHGGSVSLTEAGRGEKNSG